MRNHINNPLKYGGRAMYTPPPSVAFYPELKKSSEYPNLKPLDFFSNLSVADAPMKTKSGAKLKEQKVLLLFKKSINIKFLDKKN